MGGFEGFVSLIVFFSSIVGLLFLLKWLVVLYDESKEDVGANPNVKREHLNSLPVIYYGLAILCGIVLLGFTAANSDELSSTQIGAWIGYTVGAVLSMFAVGRVIELLQQIRDAVRNIPALSPGRSDVE